MHRHCPLQALLGIVSYTDSVKADIERRMAAQGLALPVHTRPGWYF